MGKYIKFCTSCDGKNHRWNHRENQGIEETNDMCKVCHGWGKVQTEEFKKKMSEAVSKFVRR